MSLAEALRSALIDARSPWADAPLEFLPDSGLAHAHLRLVGTGVLARIPKQSALWYRDTARRVRSGVSE